MKPFFCMCYNILATHRTPKQRERKHFHFQCSPHGKFKKRNVSTRKAWMSELERNTLAYFWRCGVFLKFSQSDQWFNNIAINTFLHSTAVDLPSSYSDRCLKTESPSLLLVLNKLVRCAVWWMNINSQIREIVKIETKLRVSCGWLV